MAALEDAAPGSTFVRKGPGPDQGLECVRRYPDGKETGWQAKFFIDKFDSGQVDDLNDSLTRALAAHPTLTRFIACLPKNLTDNRGRGKKLSEMQRYEAWVNRRVAEAKSNGRDLAIGLWDASAIEERLGRNSALYSGRLRYWFDTTRLTNSWFEKKLEISVRNLGDRYTPTSHVTLPIESALRSLARDDTFLAAPLTWSAQIERAFDQAKAPMSAAGLDSNLHTIWDAASPLLDALEAVQAPGGEPAPTDFWTRLARAAQVPIIAALESVEDLEREQQRHAKRTLFALYQAVEEVPLLVERQHWSLANERKLVVTGEAGMGKSHLLGDFGRRQVSQGRPFILALTANMDTRDPWLQIREQLDLENVTTEEFLGALDAAGQANACRAVVAIDALNEGDGRRLWHNRLQGFLAVAEDFPHVAVVMTVRDTYLGHFDFDGIPQVAHHGFAGHASEAAKVYLDQRGIARPSSPNLLKEFEHPLFLRTCCKYLDKEGLKEVPKGLNGITQLFEFFVAEAVKDVEQDMGLDKLQNLPRKALDAFLAACTEDGANGSLPLERAQQLFAELWPSGGLHQRSLLTHFISAGILTQDIVTTHIGEQESVRFTFERLYDHLRADRLLGEHVDPSDVAASFRREPLASYVQRGAIWDHGGVIEALAMQLPERFQLEIFDVAPTSAPFDEGLAEAFRRSLVWREPAAFTARTVQWLEKLANAHGDSVYAAYLLVCTEPGNPYNAEFLHSHLMSMQRPQRDAGWSVFLAADDLAENRPVATLIEWAWEAQPDKVERERLVLACTALAWHLTTPNRAVRDLATKALVHLLVRDLSIAADLLRKFFAVDDPYVTERLLASVYGAQLQGTDLARCRGLAQAVYDLYFAAGRRAPLHLLARDYCLGILEYAAHVRQLPSGIDIAACRASFRSTWPLEEVTEEDVEAYKDRGHQDSIVSSTSDHGDFGHYTVRSWLNDFTNLPRELGGKSTQVVFKAWEDAFMESGSAEQLESYVNLYRRAVDFRARARSPGFGSWEKSKKDSGEQLSAAMHEANRTFKTLLGEDELRRYRAFPEHFLLESSRMGSDEILLEDVDHGMVRRWVCRRAHELGWTPELFSLFESSGLMSYERIGKHRIERMGKKYQHIALAEATARVADNLCVSRSGERNLLTAFEYTPESLSSMRDIDPSLLIRKTSETGWAATPVTWWTPTDVQLPVGELALLRAWLQVDTDLVNGPQEIDVRDPRGAEWLVLDSFRQWTAPGQSKRVHADAWSRISALVAPRGSGKELAEELASKHRGDISRLREPERLECFLGEHGWRQPAVKLEPEDSSWSGIRTPHAGLISTLSFESLSSDNSIEDDFTLHLPTAALMQLLRLRLRNGKAPEYVDTAGITRLKDPSVHERGPGAAVISRAFFLEGLERAGLEPVWVIAGEKNVYGGQSPGQMGFGGRILHTTAYYLEAGTLRLAKQHREEMAPSSEQLKAIGASR